MFREIRTSERITDRFEDDKNLFRRIKPQTDITVEEAQAFWTAVFNAANEEETREQIDITKRIVVD